MIRYYYIRLIFLGVKNAMDKYKCPECDVDIDIPEDALNGEIVYCPDCGEEFEVSIKNNKKIDLKKMITEREDWGE